MVKGACFGVLTAVNKQGEHFTQEDEYILETLASQAAVAIQNARYLKETQKAYEELADLDQMVLRIQDCIHELDPETLFVPSYQDVRESRTNTYQAAEISGSKVDRRGNRLMQCPTRLSTSLTAWPAVEMVMATSCCPDSRLSSRL